MSDLCHVAAQKDAYVSAMRTVTKEMEERWKNRLVNCKRSISGRREDEDLQ